MKQNADELLPCPFCQSTDVRVAPVYVENAPGYGYTAYRAGHVVHLHMTCDASVSGNTEAEAIAAWNRRAEVQRLSAPQGVDEEAMRLDRYGRAQPGSVLLLEPMEDGYWTPWHIAQEEIKRLAAENAALRAASAPAPQPSLIADAARVIEWARSKPRKPAQSAFTDGPERQAAYWIEWAEGTAPLPSLDVEKEREAFLAWVNDCGCDTDGAWSAWLARASLGGKHD